jgi:proteasome lid subunit RPN8/RPN11
MNLADISNHQLRDLFRKAHQHIVEISRACGSGISPQYQIIEHGGEFDCGVLVRIVIHVDIPSRPVVKNIKTQEPVILYFPLGADFDLQVYSNRRDFPRLPHVMRRGKSGLAELCLFRTSLADWLAGKSFEDIIYRIRQWMGDAATGLLIKPDDPYEPLWVPMNGSIVEIDIDAAKCKQIPWQAMAYECKAEGRRYYRINEKGGTFPAKTFYCGNVQTEPWSVMPRLISDVKEIFDLAGFNISPEIVSANSKPDLSRFLLILGVKRPKEILGRENSDEWIAFLFERRKTKKGALIGASKKDKNLKDDDIWEIRCIPVRSVFTQQLAQKTSGWDRKTNNDTQIAVLGAGALGSKVIMNLARSGLTNILIIDKDIMMPHNLARHELDNDALGHAKAERLERRINAMYSGKTIASSFCKDVLVYQNEFCEKLKPCKLLVDLSASKSVQSVLSNLRRESMISCPIVSAFLADSGRLTFLFIDGKSRDLTADVLEAELISKHIELSCVKQWLNSGEDILQAGGGCSLMTTIVPDTLITHSAGWISHNIANLLTTENSWPDEGKIGILEMTQQNKLLSTSSKWIHVQSPKWFTSQEWKICLPKHIEDWMKQKCDEVNGNETCGIFLGVIDRWSNIVFATNAWEGPDDSAGNTIECRRGRKKLRRRLKDNLRNSGYMEWYAGEWHSHPKSSTLASSMDIRTSKEIASRLKEFGIPAILLITNGSDVSAYAFTHDN